MPAVLDASVTQRLGLDQVVERAKQRQPELAPRLERAAEIVRSSLVIPRLDGSWQVTETGAWTDVVVDARTQPACTCRAAIAQPNLLCVHALAVALVRQLVLANQRDSRRFDVYFGEPVPEADPFARFRTP
jgi:hypothetical protein